MAKKIIKRKKKAVGLTRKRENTNNGNEIVLTQEEVDRFLDAVENEEMCRYLGITDWDE